MSVAPVVFILALHLPIAPFVSMRPKLPMPNSVGVTLVGGVARTVPAYTATPRTTTERAQAHFDLISAPFLDRTAWTTHEASSSARSADSASKPAGVAKTRGASRRGRPACIR